MTCTCPKPSLHDRIIRAISLHNGEEYTDILIAAARLLVSAHETDTAEDFDRVGRDKADEYDLLVAEIDNETCCLVDDEKSEVTALRSAIETARSMGQENLAEDLEKLLAQMEEDSAEFAT